MVGISIKSDREIELMRAAGRLAAEVLDGVAEIIVPGCSTEDIDRYVYRTITAAGAIPATLNYKGFPKSCCTSVNEVVCHGIPSPYVILKAGDIVNVDVTAIREGYHGDTSRMYYVGGPEACSTKARSLVEVALQALEIGMSVVEPGKRVGDIGAAIEQFINGTKTGYGIVREYTGHGLGRNFHEPPQVIHVGRPGTGPKLRPGMTFTIEPMINLGTHCTTLSSIDGWTVRTADGELSAQWEHSILVTEHGYEVLTASQV